MPDTTITIDRDQRAGIYELVCNHPYSIDDLWTALGRSRDYATAERLGLEFGEDFRLLHDMAGQPTMIARASELTIPPHDLMDCSSACTAKPSTSSPGPRPSARRPRTTRGRTSASRLDAMPARGCLPTSTPAPVSGHECRQGRKAPSPRRARRTRPHLHAQAQRDGPSPLPPASALEKWQAMQHEGRLTGLEP